MANELIIYFHLQAETLILVAERKIIVPTLESSFTTAYFDG